MSAKHAPTPWSVGKDGYNASIIFDSNGDAVASVYGISLHTRADQLGDTDAAGLTNARLIAAAPDLLAALKEALAVLDIAEQYGLYQKQSMGWLDIVDSRDQSRAAIAKAEGRT